MARTPSGAAKDFSIFVQLRTPSVKLFDKHIASRRIFGRGISDMSKATKQ
jgi:hypothetical protein